MKSLKEISWSVDEPTYRADKALSYSTLAKYEREGFSALATLFDSISTPSLTFGNVVDTLITGTPEEFDKQYLVADNIECSDTIANIVKGLFESYKESCTTITDIPNSVIIDITEQVKYQPNWKPETRAKVIKEKGESYYRLLYIANNKIIISSQIYNIALQCVKVLHESNNTKALFEVDNPFEPYIERLYQLKFKGEFKGISIRCMFDELYVDHEKGIIQPIDLKTTKDVITFEDSFYRYNYYIQAQMYAEILRQNLEKDDYFKKFKILEYKFVAIDMYKQIPIVYEFTNTFGKTPLFYNGIWYRNWRVALKELNWHLCHPEVKLPYKMYIDYINNKGVLQLSKYLNGYLETQYEEPHYDENFVEWKDVKGYEGFYKVSNTGRVVRLERKVWSPKNNSFSIFPEKLLKLEAGSSGNNDKAYVRVTLTKDGEVKHCFVHVLVAEAFIPNPNNLSCVNHKDENPLNNCVSNLEWCTPEYNTNYGTRNTQVSVQLGIAVNQYDLEGNFIKSYRSATEACRENGWPPNRQSNISAACRGVRNSSLGYIWKFASEQ